MATVRIDASTGNYRVDASWDELVLLRELLFVTQLGQSGRAAIASRLSKAFDEADINPDTGFVTDNEGNEISWADAIVDGKIIQQKSVDTGIYWV